VPTPDPGFEPLRGCRICSSPDLFDILDLGRQPLANALVPPGAPPPASFPLAVVGCRVCGVMQLSGSVDPREMFDDYLYFSSFSASMVEAMGRLAAGVVARRQLGPSDLVVEIASNDGYLLGRYRDLGVRVLGIEPAANVARVARDAGVPTRAEYFTTGTASRLVAEGLVPNVIHANNVLAHVPDIHEFVEGLRILLPEDGVVIVETPYLLDLLDRALFDTIYHEHVFYYSLGALAELFGRHGMAIEDCEHLDVHGGSVRVTLAHDRAVAPSRRAADALQREAGRDLRSPGSFSLFAERVAAARGEIVTTLGGVKADGRTLGGYGAAAKATVLLNFAGVDATTIEYVVDLNPAKNGLLIPGTGIPVVSLDRLRTEPTDVVAVLAWNLFEEIRPQLQWYVDAGGELIVPLRRDAAA
jgi:SAM-dependent methyltransferase